MNTKAAWIYISKFKHSRTMPNAWQDYTALIFAFYNRSGIITETQLFSKIIKNLKQFRLPY